MIHTLPLGHVLHAEQLARTERRVLGPAGTADEVTVVSLLAATDRSAEPVRPSKPGRERGHHNVARYGADDEWSGDDEALGHKHHHEERDERPDVGSTFWIAEFTDQG